MTSPAFTQARLSAIASALPSIEVPSSYWDQHFDLPTGTTQERTGIVSRYRCSAIESVHSLAITSIDRVLAQAALKPSDIGLVIECSASLWQPLPSNAACLLEKLGNDWAGIPGFDIRNTCLGFVAGVDLAQALVHRHRHILVTSSETPFPVLNMSDADSAPLFGEGAAAAIVSLSNDRRPYYYDMAVFAAHRAACEIAGGGLRVLPSTEAPARNAAYCFAMDGPRVHRVASQHLPPMIQRFQAAFPAEKEATWIPHPASGPAVELLRRRLKIPSERFFCTIANHGNLISAGIPHQLSLFKEQRGHLGDIVLVGTAAGYSQAVMAWSDCDAA